MRACKCDRCGAYFDESPDSDTRISNIKLFSGREVDIDIANYNFYINLCNNCKESFRNWFQHVDEMEVECQHVDEMEAE